MAEATAGRQRLPRLHAFRSLRHGNYRLWAMGSLVSNVGTWVQRTAQDWLVLTVLTHHSASAVGVVMALQFGPQLLLLPWTGSAADRWDQRKLLMTTQAVMAVLAGILGLLTVSGAVTLWEVELLAFLLGCAAAFDAPARQSFVGQLVGDEDLPNAVALNAMTFNLANLIGPAIAGLMIGAVGIGWAFLANGASFLAVLVSLFFLDRTALRPAIRLAKVRGSFFEGLRYVWARPDLLAMLAMLFLIGTFALNFPIFISVMAVKLFHSDARGYGLLSSIMAVGTLLGAFLSAQRERPRFETLLWFSALLGVGLTAAALAPGYWVFAGALVVVGVAYLTTLNASNGLMQLTTEPAMRGRIMALRIAVALGGTPIGAPTVGWVADHFGPRWALGVGAASGFLAAGIAAAFLHWRKGQRMQSAA